MIRQALAVLALVVLIGLGGFFVGDYWASNFGLKPMATEHPRQIKLGRAPHLGTIAPVVLAVGAPPMRRLPGAKAAHQFGSARSPAELSQWLEADPIAALNWYVSTGWTVFGDDAVAVKQRVTALVAALEENRSEAAYGRRLTWSSLPGQNFSLVNEWKADGGKQLADKIASSDQGVDMMWMAAAGRPALGWTETAEWVAGLQTDERERKNLIEQMARKSFEEGEGPVAAQTFAHDTDPIYDQGRVVLVVQLIRSNPGFAQLAWESLTSPEARLTAALQILSNPKSNPMAVQLIAQWAEQAGVPAKAGPAWIDLVKRP